MPSQHNPANAIRFWPTNFLYLSPRPFLVSRQNVVGHFSNKQGTLKNTIEPTKHCCIADTLLYSVNNYSTGPLSFTYNEKKIEGI